MSNGEPRQQDPALDTSKLLKLVQAPTSVGNMLESSMHPLRVKTRGHTILTLNQGFLAPVREGGNVQTGA